MLQAVISYAIVVLAAGWLIWRLFLPETIRCRFSPRAVSETRVADCSDGCAACPGCPPVKGPLSPLARGPGLRKIP